jgi:hypothetical protein
MRAFVAMLALGLTIDAAAQESTIRTISPAEAAQPPAQVTPAPITPPPSVTVPPPQPNDAATAVRAAPSPEYQASWHKARIVSVTGSVVNTVGTLLSLTSIIYIGVTNWPPEANDVLSPKASPSDPGPALAYTGASLSTAGFILNAAGLGYEHHVLDRLGYDPGRGLYGFGTTLGLLGILGTGASYFFGATSYLNPHDQGNAIIATSITGAALCGVAGILYAVDSSHVLKAWRTLSTF